MKFLKIKQKNSKRIVEYNEYNFFDLIKKAENSLSNKGKLLAEAHSRNTVTFLPIAFVLIVLITTLNGSYSRMNSIYKKIISVGFLILIQSTFIIIQNIVHSNLTLLPLMYLFPILIIILGLIILYKNINLKKIRSIY